MISYRLNDMVLSTIMLPIIHPYVPTYYTIVFPQHILHDHNLVHLLICLLVYLVVYLLYFYD